VAALAAIPGQAYYHYVHYASRNAPFQPIPEAFNLNALPDKTVVFTAADSGPTAYGRNDTFGGVLSQVKQAAAAWNSVPGAALHVVFGGIRTANQVSTLPGGDVIFADLPPGLLGMGTPKMADSATPVGGDNGDFLPIARGLVVLTANTASQPGPSYLESYYTTAVHEFGHALGLQHTWTGAAMSQDVIRNTSRARPIDADDNAAFLALYGKPGWSANYGSISGRVSMGGTGVAMASVVAIAPTGSAVSTLTNPDGTYTIRGLPPNSYLLYVHPLPPDAIVADGTGLVPPADLTGNVLPPTAGAFQTVFYPGTLDPQAATSFSVTSGWSATNQDFDVQPRPSPPAYNMVTYSYLDTLAHTYTYLGSLPTTPAYVDVTQSLLTVVARANSGPTAVPQSVTMLGGFTAPYLMPFGQPLALALYFNTPAAPGSGPRHLVFNYGSDIYVLPDAVNLVAMAPPQVRSVTPNGDGTVTVAGTGLGPDSRVFFDGLEATASPFSGDRKDGAITVVPPTGQSGQTAAVTVFNSDGQNSTFWQDPAAPTYLYPPGNVPMIQGVNPPALPAGARAIVEISGANTAFADGQVTVGFGTDDVRVNRVWVLSPSRVVADVVVAPDAAVGLSEVSVISGFQVLGLASSFQVQPANPALPNISSVASESGDPLLYAGTVAVIAGSNLAQPDSLPQVTLNDIPVAVRSAAAGQVSFVIPQIMPAGPAVLALNNGSAAAFRVMIQIDAPPPTIVGAYNAAGIAIDAGHPAAAGDLVIIMVTGLDASAARIGRVTVTVAGVPMSVQQITPAMGGQFAIQFTLSRSYGGSQPAATVAVDGAPSLPFPIATR
jgi:uncharacterized protein (TIGR03437 family)